MTSFPSSSALAAAREHVGNDGIRDDDLDRWIFTSGCPVCHGVLIVDGRGARCEATPASCHDDSVAIGLGLGAETATGSLSQRLADARVDLLSYIENGVPPREWLPSSDHMLARGARHHIAAPLKSGKSLAFLAHAVDMVAAGARVAILDRENGADEYARRLADVLADRPDSARDAVRDRLAYYAWPTLRLDDARQLGDAFNGIDLVVLDSTRTFLSSLALDENTSDDFAKFATAILEPLFRAGIATVQLDNTGHGDKGRARGSSSKGDLADVLYSLKTVSAFDRDRAGRVRLVRQHSRFGDIGAAFSMELGAGNFGVFTADDENTPGTGFRPTALMERISRAIEDHPGLTKRAIREAVKGTNNDAKELALGLLVSELFVAVEPDGRGFAHRSLRPYREDHDRPCLTVPDRAPAQSGMTVPGVPRPLKGARSGHGPNGTAALVQRARSESDAA